MLITLQRNAGKSDLEDRQLLVDGYNWQCVPSDSPTSRGTTYDDLYYSEPSATSLLESLFLMICSLRSFLHLRRQCRKRSRWCRHGDGHW